MPFRSDQISKMSELVTTLLVDILVIQMELKARDVVSLHHAPQLPWL